MSSTYSAELLVDGPSGCDCGNAGDTYGVGSWDGTDWALTEIEKALQALPSERAMPEEPTHQMIVAMHHAMWDGGPEADPVPGSVGYEHWKQIYGAALAAHRHRGADE